LGLATKAIRAYVGFALIGSRGVCAGALGAPANEGSDMERAVLVYTTYPSVVEAERAGRAIVERRLAACVNILPSVPIPKFAQSCSTTDANFGIEGH
jgi:hypothetical protein